MYLFYYYVLIYLILILIKVYVCPPHNEYRGREGGYSRSSQIVGVITIIRIRAINRGRTEGVGGKQSNNHLSAAALVSPRRRMVIEGEVSWH